MPEEKKEEVKSQRDEIYEKFQRENYQEPEAEKKAEEPKAEEVAAPAEAEKKEEPKPEEKPKEEAAKKEEKKFVPYEALHAERVKRKAEADRFKAERERADALEQELAKLKQAEPQPEFQTESDRRLYELDIEVKALKNIESQRLKLEEKKKQEDFTADLNTRVDRAAKELADNGFPGLKRHIGEVYRKLQSMVADGREEDAQALDNPTGWKKIYQEEIFPEIETEFQESFKKRSTEKKVELKKQAGLVNSPGKSEPKPKSDDDKSEDELRTEYMAMRRASVRV